MVLEKEKNNIKWFRNNSLKIKQINEGEYTNIAVLLDGYNICFKLMIFEILDHIKRDLDLDVKIIRILNNQRSFVVDTKNASALVNYVVLFIDEWDIKISESNVSMSDIISDELWYG